ncbi:site-2 protease family protein [soil metagenome]
MTEQSQAKVRRGPSPIFLGLVALTAVSGWALWTGFGSPGIAAFIFVAAFWVVTLCLHEFAHALVAYRNGDHSVVYRGYLTLDPLRYTHVLFSIVLPLVFLLLGGIGLPGGAVFIDQRALRTRFARSAVSAAGPLTNIAVAILLAIALALRDGVTPFWAAIAFLAFLQVTAAVLNILPIPGLDGFGIVEPYLPPRWLAGAARVAPFAIIGLFALLWIPVVNAAFFSGILGLLDLLGIPRELVGAGYGLFQFWR